MVNDRRKSYQSSPTCCWCGKRESEDEPDKRGLNTKLHLAVDKNGLPIRAIITAGTTADCSPAEYLIQGIQARYLLADRGYDSNAILQKATQADMLPVIPAKKTENIREITTKIYTKCAIELKMLSCILNGGVESPHVIVKIQTLF